VNPSGVDGLLAGSSAQLLRQSAGVVVVGVYAFAVSWMLFKSIHAIFGLRLTDEDEVVGMDSTEHSETAYNN
jgi:Amt family ammonium transporter